MDAEAKCQRPEVNGEPGDLRLAATHPTTTALTAATRTIETVSPLVTTKERITEWQITRDACSPDRTLVIQAASVIVEMQRLAVALRCPRFFGTPRALSWRNYERTASALARFDFVERKLFRSVRCYCLPRRAAHHDCGVIRFAHFVALSARRLGPALPGHY